MTFTYDGADWSTTIGRYRTCGNAYHIDYLDGSCSDYYSSNPNESQKIEQIMMEQAIDRAGAMKIENLRLERGIITVTAAVSSFGLSVFYSKQALGLAAIAMGGMATSIYSFREKGVILHELKKYKMFLEMESELSEAEKSKLLDLIEPDRIYQIPLTINNLDSYSYGTIKTIYKEFNKS